MSARVLVELAVLGNEAAEKDLDVGSSVARSSVLVS